MPSVCIYFQVHQPLRIRKYRVFDIGLYHDYFSDVSDTNLNNRRVLAKVAQKSYIPANELMLKLLKKYKEFKLSYSFSGVILEQLESFDKKVLDSFKRLVDTGRVEILAETYYHSLSFFFSRQEFESQVKLHSSKIKKIFGVTPVTFRNTELAYSNDVGKWAESAGYKAVLAEGWDTFLGWRSPNFLYKPAGTKKIKLLLKNYKLSDDIAFRFSERGWSGWPLTADKFAGWITNLNGNADVINLFMDYETLGEHQWKEEGIFDFIYNLPAELLSRPDNDFVTPSQAADRFSPVGEVDVPYVVTWADSERDLSAWIGNEMQSTAINSIYSLESEVKNTGNKEIIKDWRRLQVSDHFYYMCTKWFSDGDVHKYFNPYESPYDAFICYMNAVNDLRLRVRKLSRKSKIKKVDRSLKIDYKQLT
jgi:alpha-amylase